MHAALAQWYKTRVCEGRALKLQVYTIPLMCCGLAAALVMPFVKHVESDPGRAFALGWGAAGPRARCVQRPVAGAFVNQLQRDLERADVFD